MQHVCLHTHYVRQILIVILVLIGLRAYCVPNLIRWWSQEFWYSCFPLCIGFSLCIVHCVFIEYFVQLYTFSERLHMGLFEYECLQSFNEPTFAYSAIHCYIVHQLSHNIGVQIKMFISIKTYLVNLTYSTHANAYLRFWECHLIKYVRRYSSEIRNRLTKVAWGVPLCVILTRPDRSRELGWLSPGEFSKNRISLIRTSPLLGEPQTSRDFFLDQTVCNGLPSFKSPLALMRDGWLETEQTVRYKKKKLTAAWLHDNMEIWRGVVIIVCFKFQFHFSLP